MIEGFKIPCVTFKMRVRDDSIDGSNPYKWQDVTSDSLLKGRRILLFSLPGAFTPTCSTYQLPGFEQNYDKIRNQDIDEIYCISVNDAFVMNAWAKDQKLENVKVIPDGSGRFTRGMGMLVRKDPEDFGYRSWRYAAHIEDCVVKKMWVEEGKMDDCPTDPYGATNPQEILEDLQNVVK
mgnify:CR=1 FL=1